jgi:hypothetical protein
MVGENNAACIALCAADGLQQRQGGKKLLSGQIRQSSRELRHRLEAPSIASGWQTGALRNTGRSHLLLLLHARHRFPLAHAHLNPSRHTDMTGVNPTIITFIEGYNQEWVHALKLIIMIIA